METVGADTALQLLKFLRVMGVGARLPGLSSKVQSPLNFLIAGRICIVASPLSLAICLHHPLLHPLSTFAALPLTFCI